MSEVGSAQHTPPGGWPWGKGKDAAEHVEHSQKNPPEYFEGKKDDTTNSSKDTPDSKNPVDELKQGLQGSKGDDAAPVDSDKLKEVDPAALTDEEKKKLTPGGEDSDIVTQAKKGAEGATDDAQEKTEDVSKEAEGKKEDVTEDVGDKTEDVTKQAEDKKDEVSKEAEGKMEDVTKEAEGKTGDVTEEAEGKKDDLSKEAEGKTGDVAEQAEEKKDDVAEEAGEKTDDVSKEAEGTTEGLKEGEVPKEGEEAAEGVTKEGDEAVKEGEEAAKEGQETTEEAAPTDLSVLKGGKVNKGGNIVNDDGKVLGRIKEGVLADLVGKRVDENGIIWNDSGKQVGAAELIPESEREAMEKEPAPFESFPDATVDGEGYVTFNGERVGKVVDGDLQRLRGMKVDPDGDILDRGGNVVGKATRWEPEKEPEPEPEPEKDRSILAGKRVNKAGNVVDGQGNIFGKVVEGDPKKMVGRMCDKQGQILSESGDVLGRAEVVPEGEREGTKEGPFAELSGCTVAKDGKVVTPGGDVVGRLVSGDAKALFGRAVDEDGDVCDKNGNVLGKAERWEEPEVEKKKNAMSGRRVNKEGNVVDEDGNLVGKLTSGELSVCAGKEIDDDGDVVDGKGNTIGHVSLLDEIPQETESEDDKTKREQAEQDKKLAQQMSYCLTQCLDKVKPICTMITSKIEKAERTPKEELDEEKLVTEVKPLIEEGGKILQEANGIIRGLDPDGHIQANAKHRTASHEATPEEYHLADILKELTGTVTTTIDNAKKKIEDMPHAKKELSPLWGLLSEPLFQILAAVGLLLNGVLGLVGRLLSGLGLGGLVDSLLGGLGVKNILQALGIGSLSDSLTGKNQKGGGKKGGLLGLGG